MQRKKITVNTNVRMGLYAAIDVVQALEWLIPDVAAMSVKYQCGVKPWSLENAEKALAAFRTKQEGV